MPKRPPISADLEREVLLEAGHRCAIHTCRQTPIELAHIIPWSRCKTHTYDNIIALCPTCHTRYDKNEIDKKSMLEYKARLSLHSGKFTRFEYRLLKRMRDSGVTEIWLLDELELMIDGLIDGKFLVAAGEPKPLGADDATFRTLYRLTSAGEEFIEKIYSHA